MVFRKLYWVTEKVHADNTHHFLGVFTSIPNLLKQGIHDNMDLNEVRLSLTKLDCEGGVMASWLGSDYSKLQADLRQFVDTDEFTAEQADALIRQINQLNRTISRSK